ncbi:MAG TPA: hypothetical protein VNY05_11630 [Candidatus Acidoferrales bacterium]|jgi:hypothetical protein|nr:hypothetical protein [Candidatus Acidoferrales bacterium]
MRLLFRGWAIATSATVAVLYLATTSLSGQPAYKGPRMPDGKPNLNGIWQALNTANWDLQDHAARPGLAVALGATGAEPGGPGVVEGGEIPYLPAAKEKKKANFDQRLTADPEVKCYLPGVPRATYMPYPFQIFHSAKAIFFAYEYDGAVRNIYLKDPGPAPADSWMGQSVGHWEGDTLVVDVTGLDERTWFDRAGNFHGDALHVVERYAPLGPDTLSYEATIEDPTVFSRPWKIKMPLYRHVEKNARLVEFKCVEFVEELMYGEFTKKTAK